MNDLIKNKDVVFIGKSFNGGKEKGSIVTSNYDVFYNFLKNEVDHKFVKIYVDGLYLKGISERAELELEDIMCLVDNWLIKEINKEK